MPMPAYLRTMYEGMMASYDENRDLDISPYLPVSPRISPNLAISPHTSKVVPLHHPIR